MPKVDHAAPMQLKSFQIIVESSPISTQIFSKDGMTIMVNKAWERLWHIKSKDIVGNYNILKDKQLVEKGLMTKIKKAFNGQKIHLPTIEYIPSKTVPKLAKVPYRWVSAIIYPIFNSSKKVTHVVLQHTDVTTQHDIQKLITKNSEANYRLGALVASSDDAIIGKTRTGIITSWNHGAEQLFGFSAKEAIGNSIMIIVPSNLQDEEKDILKKINIGESIQHFQTSRRKKDGTIIPVSVTISPIKNDKGKIIGASNITRDITEQKKTEQEKSDFLSMASHELKTPLTSMKIFLGLLVREIEKQDDSEHAQYFMSRIQDQTNQLIELTNDLLDVSRIETGKLRLNSEEFALEDLVHETVEAIETSTRTHKILVNAKDTFLAKADRYRIFQVLINLLTNAIKYSPPGKDIIVTLQKDKNFLTVSVQDFGIGIDKVQQNKVFEKLYQVGDSKEKTYPGLGLGLYISKEIIERHKGQIWVKSKKGKGSTFFFTLPREQKKSK